jgi:hypothetical protein
MHCMSCIWVWLVASCMEATEGVRLRMNKPFWCGVPQCHRCPFVLFSYYSYICAFCPFIAFFSPLIFLQQRLLESLIQAKKWGVMLRLFQTSQEPLCSLYVYSLLPPFLLYAMILFSFLIHFVLDPWVSVNCHGIVTAFCLWFDIPCFLTIPRFSSLYDVCIVCYTINIYLTTLFDVYCMLFQSIRCMHSLPSTKCTLRLPSHLYQFV